MKDSTKSVWVISIFIGASVLVCAGLVWYFWPYLQNYDSYTVKIEELIKGYTIRLGGWGWLFVIALNVIQIVIAILPGEPVELQRASAGRHRPFGGRTRGGLPHRHSPFEVR